jgi:Predicted nucleotide-binding protein containing TIR-like domain
MVKSKIFVASSGRTLVLADKLRDELNTQFSKVTLWDEASRARPGLTVIEWLESLQNQYDFAIILLTKDDLLSLKDHQTLKARDNCIFEAGLFMSALGRKRCFLVNSVNQNDLPSDLAGIISMPFQEPPNLQEREACNEAIIRVAGRLKDIVQRDGPRVPQITITSPRDVLEGGESRSEGRARSYQVLGTFAHLPSDHKIWVLNENDQGDVYPQKRVVLRSERSEWEGSTHVWNTQNSIRMLAVAAPPTSNKLFEFYHSVLPEAKKAVPIRGLPDECIVGDWVRLRRE